MPTREEGADSEQDRNLFCVLGEKLDSGLCFLYPQGQEAWVWYLGAWGGGAGEDGSRPEA